MSAQARAMQLRMQERATSRLLASGDWILPEEVARLGQRSRGNADALARRWVRSGLIYSIRHQGKNLYPAYALDRETGYRPAEALKPVLEVLHGAGRQGWAIAFWFDSPNSWLAGRRPKDCLAGPRDELLVAARAESLGTQHS